MEEPSGRQAVLAAFDQLFDKAAGKLRLEVADEDKERAVRSFSQRFEIALEMADRITFPAVPSAVMAEMESTIDELSPAQLVGYVAAAPLAVKLEEIVRHLALAAAQQRLIDHVLDQADDSYGGN